MQKHETASGPKGPSASLLQDERDAVQRERERAKEREDLDDSNESMRAIIQGQEYTDLRGKRIRGRGRNVLSSAPYTYLLQNKIKDIFTQQALIALSWDALKSVQEFYSAAAAFAMPSAPAVQPSIKKHFEDENYVYGEMLVSKETHIKLMDELAKVAAISQKIDLSTDPWEENRMRDQRTSLVQEFEMRLLPDRSAYVHCQSRVQRLEELLGKKSDVVVPMPVMVFFEKARNDGGMRVYAKVGDAFNDDPAEIIATGDHLKGAPPPEFRHS